MKEFKKPFLTAMLYVLLTLGYIALDHYYILPAIIRHGTSGANFNFELSQSFERFRNITGLIFLPLLIFTGTLHTFLILPISKHSKKKSIIVSLFFGMIVPPCIIYYETLTSIDGSMLWLGVFIFSSGVASITLILRALSLLFIKFIRHIRRLH